FSICRISRILNSYLFPYTTLFRSSHIQRGGTPTARDRVFATLMGARSVDLLIEGQKAIYLGVREEQLTVFDIVETLEKTEHHVRQDLFQLNQELTDRGN